MGSVESMVGLSKSTHDDYGEDSDDDVTLPVCVLVV